MGERSQHETSAKQSNRSIPLLSVLISRKRPRARGLTSHLRLSKLNNCISSVSVPSVANKTRRRLFSNSDLDGYRSRRDSFYTLDNRVGYAYCTISQTIDRSSDPTAQWNGHDIVGLFLNKIYNYSLLRGIVTTLVVVKSQFLNDLRFFNILKISFERDQVS